MDWRRHPIKFLDEQVAIAFPKRIPRLLLGLVFLVVGLLILQIVAGLALIVGLFGLLAAFGGGSAGGWFGFIAVVAVFGLLGAVLTGLGISGVRSRRPFDEQPVYWS